MLSRRTKEAFRDTRVLLDTYLDVDGTPLKVRNGYTWFKGFIGKFGDVAGMQQRNGGVSPATPTAPNAPAAGGSATAGAR